MKKNSANIGNLFLLTALSMLLIGLCFGLLAALCYLFPDFLKERLGFISLRPLHVSSAMFWIILGGTGCIYSALKIYTKKETDPRFAKIQWGLWIIAIGGIFYSYFTQNFGGREYWEFNPVWAFPIVFAWIIFL